MSEWSPIFVCWACGNTHVSIKSFFNIVRFKHRLKSEYLAAKIAVLNWGTRLNRKLKTTETAFFYSILLQRISNDLLFLTVPLLVVLGWTTQHTTLFYMRICGQNGCEIRNSRPRSRPRPHFERLRWLSVCINCIRTIFSHKTNHFQILLLCWYKNRLMKLNAHEDSKWTNPLLIISIDFFPLTRKQKKNYENYSLASIVRKRLQIASVRYATKKWEPWLWGQLSCLSLLSLNSNSNQVFRNANN